jgi:hypothetical protein
LKQWVIISIVFLGSFIATAFVCYYLAIILVGPHSDIMPGFLYIPVLVILWLSIPGIPCWLSLLTYKKLTSKLDETANATKINIKHLRFVLISVTIMVISLPLSFLMTFILVPLWSWFEKTSGIESLGHSGPADWCYIAVYLLLVGIIESIYLIIKRNNQVY